MKSVQELMTGCLRWALEGAASKGKMGRLAYRHEHRRTIDHTSSRVRYCCGAVLKRRMRAYVGW